jgi:SAM-dependent methyltransferase
MNRTTTRILGALRRFNAAHPWSHNAFYTPWIVRQARAVRRHGGRRALDIGCGTGELLTRLAVVMPEVVGIEPDGRTAARARARVAEHENAIVREEPFDPAAAGDETFDLVTLVAVLHHLPLAPTLRAARDLVAPGGRLVVVGLAREAPADLPWSLASVILNPVIGLLRHPRRARVLPESMTAPLSEPTHTFDQIAAVARDVLPEVTIRRRLFWRYTAVWIRRVD